MKKFFMFLAVASLMMTSTACGGRNGRPSGDIDSMAYAVGAKYGLSINFNMGELGLDNELIKDGIESFLKDGDVENEDFRADSQRLMQFMYTKANAFMRAKMVNDSVETDQPDTLPALPELFDEEFTREDISRLVGQDMGAAIKMNEPEVDRDWMWAGLNDATKVSSQEAIDTELAMTMEQMNQVYMKYMEAERQRRIEERMAKISENKAAGAEWLAEIEKQEGVQKTESGILYRIDREGTGAQATKDEDVVKVNYEGKTRDGKVFDSSYERGEAISFPLNRVIKGWTEGMKLVKEGGQITLWIPENLAYGESGAGEDIGPCEALEFKVELLELNPEE